MNARKLGLLIVGCLTLCLSVLSGPARANLFVSSYGLGSVLEYTPSGSLVGSFVAAGSGGLNRPSRLHFGPDGNLYVASDSAIKVYDGQTGAYLRDFASGSPLDFTFDGAGNLYAVDITQVLKYDATGALIRTYTDGVSTPQGVIVGPHGHLLVTNTYDGAYRNTVTELDPSDGSFTTFATGLGEPVGIAVGPDGRYYAANFTYAGNFGGTNPDTVQVIGAGGGASTTWNQGGGLFGASYLSFAGGRLYVTSFYNSTVQVFDAATGTSLGAFAAGSQPTGITASPVPEPATLLLAAIGLCAVMWRAARRSNADDAKGISVARARAA